MHLKAKLQVTTSKETLVRGVQTAELVRLNYTVALLKLPSGDICKKAVYARYKISVACLLLYYSMFIEPM